MEMLIIGLILFSITHLIPSFHEFRESLVKTLGANYYKIIFSIISIISVVLIVYGFKMADEIILFTPPPWGYIVTFVLMLPASYLFMSNSAGSAPSSAQFLTAHPLSWGVVMWSLGHLIMSGEVSTVALFSTFLVIGLSSILTGKMRGLKPRKKIRPPILKEMVFLVIVGVIYSMLIIGHGYISGINLI